MSEKVKGVLEVHSYAKNFGSPTQVVLSTQVTVIEFESTLERASFADHLIKNENMDMFTVKRVFHLI